MPGSERPREGGPDREGLTFVRGRAGRVGFLDAPGAAPAELLQAIDGVFAELPPGGVLAVYGDPTVADEISELCERRGVELIAVIPHNDRGTTFTIAVPDGPESARGWP